MLLFWIVMAAIVYFLLLGLVLVFFASVSKANEHWERTFHEAHPHAGRHGDDFYRAA